MRLDFIRYVPIAFAAAAVTFAATAAFANDSTRGHLNPAATPAELVVDPHVVGDPSDRRPDLSVMENLY